MSHTADCHDLLQRREALCQAPANPGELRPGSLKSRYRKCGKPNCHCAQPGDPGHGPNRFLARVVKGKMHSRAVPVGALARTREQLAECRRLRALTAELTGVSDRLCQAQPAGGKAAADKKSRHGAQGRCPQ